MIFALRTGANAVMLLRVAGFFGTVFGSLCLEPVLGFDALGIGLGFVPVSLSVGLMSFVFSAEQASRRAARPRRPP